MLKYMFKRVLLILPTLFGAVLLLACQSTQERLASLDRDKRPLRPPVVTELDGGSAFASLETRPGITQRLVLIKAPHPAATVLLFAGGGGVLNLSPPAGSALPAPGGLRGNFLIRSREAFVDRDLNTVLVDAPSDRQGLRGMLGGFRTTGEHVKDIEGIVRFVRQRTGLPVWLVGTSRGTESAAYAAIHSRVPIDGVVLTSPITVSNRNGTSVTEHALAKITASVLVVYHEDDECEVTPPSGARSIAAELRNAKTVAVTGFSGGGPATGGVCQAHSEHGFLHIEDRVIDAISEFIKANR